MRIDTILNIISTITAFDPSARFVGSVSMNYHELANANDIDVLTNDIDLYDKYIVNRWNRPTTLSENGERGTARIDGIKIDLFEINEADDTNQYEDINGGKLQTLNSLLKFHQSLMNKYVNQEPSVNRDVYLKKTMSKINKLLDVIFI